MLTGSRTMYLSSEKKGKKESNKKHTMFSKEGRLGLMGSPRLLSECASIDS